MQEALSRDRQYVLIIENEELGIIKIIEKVISHIGKNRYFAFPWEDSISKKDAYTVFIDLNSDKNIVHHSLLIGKTEITSEIIQKAINTPKGGVIILPKDLNSRGLIPGLKNREDIKIYETNNINPPYIMAKKLLETFGISCEQFENQIKL